MDYSIGTNGWPLRLAVVKLANKSINKGKTEEEGEDEAWGAYNSARLQEGVPAEYALPLDAHERQAARDEQAQIEQLLVLGLARRRWTARAYWPGARVPDDVPSEWWSLGAKLDIKANTATANGTTIHGVTVHDPIAVEAVSPAHAEEEAVPPVIYTTGHAGRPSSRHLLMSEFRRRKDAGQIAESTAAEARYLHQWLVKTHPEAPSATPPTIANAIRAEYRLGKAAKSPQ